MSAVFLIECFDWFCVQINHYCYADDATVAVCRLNVDPADCRLGAVCDICLSHPHEHSIPRRAERVKTLRSLSFALVESVPLHTFVACSISIFLILGIGVDDSLIFYNTFKQVLGLSCLVCCASLHRILTIRYVATDDG